ncbi:MAG: TlpA disulfide reductase family protein [Ekhidna sp.]|uniref:TlpA family protein disulfide reductase n=1 Tax=Ekhidna sp. TaxID=2608089 RepID=UPI0032EAE185
MERKIKKEIIEWAVLLTVIGVIYLGGWHTEVIGRMQQVVLSTGIISPDYSDEEKLAAYDFWLEDIDGNQVDFRSFKGEVVFLNFWATWCPPCVAEMPDIHNLYEQTDPVVRFVMISLDRDEQKAKEFVKRKEFDFPVYFLRSNLPASYDTHSIPTTYVLDKTGRIKVENQGMAKYNTSKFREMLSGLVEAQ